MLKTRESAFEMAIVEHQFQKLSDYFKNMSEYIINQKSYIEESSKKFAESGDDSECYADDWYIVKMLEEQFCYLMIIAINTLIEKELARIKKCFRRDNDNKKNIESNINNASHTAFLDGIRAIRNAIAHGNGELGSTGENDMKKIKVIVQDKQILGCKIRNYDLNKNRQKLEINFDFISYCLTKSREELRDIIEQLYIQM